MIRIGSSGGQMPGNYPQDGVKVPARGDNMVASAGSLIKSGLIYQSGIYVKLMMENGKWKMANVLLAGVSVYGHDDRSGED